MKEKLFILKYDGGEYYIGEARTLRRTDSVEPFSVTVGDYCDVDDLEKALPFTERQAKHILEGAYGDEAHQKILGKLRALPYNGGENLD
ncbi:hypothetical protein [Treponema bryantii]|nr:hypothetical protein [Treponema bryantii]